jgi:glutamate synthase domain-containing protein 2
MPSLTLFFQSRFLALLLAILAVVAFAVACLALPYSWWLLAGLVVAAALTAVGIHDVTQTRHSILRNYPIIAHLRFIFEEIRPELRQYFFEGDKDGTPFSRDRRAVVYQRAKMALDVRPRSRSAS